MAIKSFKNFVTRANNWATPRIQNKLPLWCFPVPHLRFKAYCVGAAKTGTTTISSILSNNQYLSAHEAESGFLLHNVLAFYQGKIDENQFIAYIKHRDRRLGLEMDSSHLNYDILDILVNEFIEAKFILTIRDCYSWLESLITHHYPTYSLLVKNKIKKNLWAKLYDIHFKANQFEHVKEEKVLADNGLYTLDGYFSHWREHNQKVLTTVPKEKLLVIKTTEINQRITEIETFLGIKPGSLPNDVRDNARGKKIDIIKQINKDFLEEKARFHCKELMDKYFPEVKGFNDS